MNARVLLVEDNENNRYLATFLLQERGAHVLHARNGAEGVAAAQRERPDIIVMDIQMPEMDGYEAARLILADETTRHIPIVAASSYAMTGDRAKALALGFTDYIEKPYDPETFASRVLRTIARATPSP